MHILEENGPKLQHWGSPLHIVALGLSQDQPSPGPERPPHSRPVEPEARARRPNLKPSGHPTWMAPRLSSEDHVQSEDPTTVVVFFVERAVDGVVRPRRRRRPAMPIDENSSLWVPKGVDPTTGRHLAQFHPVSPCQTRQTCFTRDWFLPGWAVMSSQTRQSNSRCIAPMGQSPT